MKRTMLGPRIKHMLGNVGKVIMTVFFWTEMTKADHFVHSVATAHLHKS